MKIINWKNLKLKKGDYFILIIAVVLLFLCLLFDMFHRKGNIVRVDMDGIVHEYDLETNQNIILDNRNGNVNEIVIKDGEVYVSSSNCLNQNCVRHNPISRNGEMIVCIPHKVVIQVLNNNDNGFDN